jgi:hypothetical protein
VRIRPAFRAYLFAAVGFSNFAVQGQTVAHASTVEMTPVVSSEVPVPPVVYRSVLAIPSRSAAIAEDDWKEANAAVGRFKRGHIDILKKESEQVPSEQPKQDAHRAGLPRSENDGVKP